jgi:LacI family transcriptional regulator
LDGASNAVEIAPSALRAARAHERPTIRAVAERAQVAISTVSRVLNGGAASEDARSRVRLAVEALGYAPSLAAQSLVTRRTGCVGLAVNSSQSPWFSQILAGLEDALLLSRKSVLLASMMQSGRYDPSAVSSWIQERRVDGLVLVRFSRRNQPLFNAAVRANLPVVLIAPDIAAPAQFTVRCDNFEGGRLVGRHLAGLGHRRVSFVGGPRESLDTRHRLRGLNEGVSERGVTIRNEDISFGSTYAPQFGIDYAGRFLSERPARRPTAVVLGNDVMALAFMRCVLQRGVQVPDEVSVVGFDGVADGALSWPGLTTVIQPTRLMSARACQALLECVEGRDENRSKAAEYGVELVVRESTGPVTRRARPRHS